MPNLKPLDRVRTYLERSHSTKLRDLPSILSQDGIHPDRFGVVFTTAGNPLKVGFADPLHEEDYNSTIFYHVPKQWHRKYVVKNPNWDHMEVDKDPDWSGSYERNAMNRQEADVARGGRVTTYGKTLPNEFIDRICFGPDLSYCYDRDALRQHILDGDPRSVEFFNRYGRH